MPAEPQISVLSFDAQAMVFLFLGASVFVYFKCMYLAGRGIRIVVIVVQTGHCQTQYETIRKAKQLTKQSISCTQVVFVLLVTAVGTSLFEAAARFAQAPLQVAQPVSAFHFAQQTSLKRCRIP